MKLGFERVTVVDFSSLEKLFFETYGYEVDIMSLFDDDVCNDSYQCLYLDIVDGDNEDFLKTVKLLRDNGFNEDKILIKICW